MPLNKDLLCQTSAWHNNCGLNGLTHFLASKLETGELIEKFSRDPHYLALLDSFQEYYDLPNRPTWEEIRALFRKHTAATDKEAIFAPVLRKYLGKVILPKAEGLWDFHVAGALTDYLQGKPTSDIAEPIIHSNEAMIESLARK